MARVKGQASTTIDRSPKDVFAFVSSAANRPKWIPITIEVEALPDGGTREVQQWMGRRIEEVFHVTEREDDRKIASRSEPGQGSPVDIWRTETFVPSGDGTTFTLVLEIEDNGLFGDGSPQVQTMMQRELDADVAHLKDILEAEPHLESVATQFPT